MSGTIENRMETLYMFLNQGSKVFGAHLSRDVVYRDHRQYLYRVRRERMRGVEFSYYQRETESCTCKMDALPGHHDFVSGESNTVELQV